jgi:SAM-dependent methyltransferase
MRFASPRPVLETSRQPLQEWYKSIFGQHLLSQEQALAGDRVRSYFGHNLIQLSSLENAELFSECRIHQKLSLNCFPDTEQTQHCITTEFEALPIATESVDVVVLHHVLEFSKQPHQMLREVQRVLVPHGRVIIFGINPYSFLGLTSALKGLGASNRLRSRPIGLGRLDDWLNLLGFSSPVHRFDCYEIPSNISAVITASMLYSPLAARFQLPGGGIYVAEAIKEVQRLTPLKSKAIKFGSGFDIPIFGGIATSKIGATSDKR